MKAAEWLVAKDPMLLGSDNWPVEVAPNPDKQISLPVHQIALVVNGVHLLENMKLDELAAKQVYEFAFIMQPLKIQGGLGLDRGAGRGAVSIAASLAGRRRYRPARRQQHAGRGGEDQREADRVRGRRPLAQDQDRAESRYAGTHSKPSEAVAAGNATDDVEPEEIGRRGSDEPMIRQGQDRRQAERPQVRITFEDRKACRRDDDAHDELPRRRRSRRL